MTSITIRALKKEIFHCKSDLELNDYSRYGTGGRSAVIGSITCLKASYFRKKF